MVIETMSPAILKARKSILEFLLINHPLDCPVCDKAGDCRLQDLVHEHGLDAGTFAEKKKKLPPDLSSAIIERNTVAASLRKCVRITEQIAEHELALTWRGGRSRVSTTHRPPLASSAEMRGDLPGRALRPDSSIQGGHGLEETDRRMYRATAA
jgi:NADH dehydrogenase/NADH:ubiquinone oxidoreductase subunit G